jgi:hypothetical protein
MGKYTKYTNRPESKPRPWKVHPIWRGIGCFMLILGPFVAVAAAHYLVEYNMEQGWLPVPADLARTITVPVFNYPVEHLYGDLLAGGVFLLIGTAVVMVIYSLIYAILGPSRFGPLDAPPIRSNPSQRRQYQTPHQRKPRG